MMKKNLYQIIFLLFILVSCGKPKERSVANQSEQPGEHPVLNQTEQPKDLPVLDISAVIERTVQNTFSWNSVAEQVTLIPIETTDDILFANPEIVHISDDSYYLTDYRTNSIARVDRNGKVITSFSRQGQGPGEFAQMGTVHVNQEKGIIQMITTYGGMKRIEYDLTGNLIRETGLSGRGFSSVLFISDDYIVFNGPLRGVAHKVYVTDTELNIVQSLFPKDPALRTNVTSNTLNRDIAFIDLDEDETVFKITDKGAEPVFILKEGSYRPDPGQSAMHINSDGYYAILPSFIGMVGVGAFQNYYLIRYMRDVQAVYELWSKTDNRIVSRNFELTLPSGKKITKCVPHYIYEDTIAFIIQAHRIFEEIEGMKEDDNPVIVHIKLKTI